MSESRCPYQAIMVASANGRGLRLTADEVDKLSNDGAIETVASNGLTDEDAAACETKNHWEFWRLFGKRRAALAKAGA